MALLGVTLGSNGLGCAPGALFFADDSSTDSPCLGPSLKDVRNYDTPIRDQIHARRSAGRSGGRTAQADLCLMMLPFICSFRNKNEHFGR